MLLIITKQILMENLISALHYLEIVLEKLQHSGTNSAKIIVENRYSW